MKLSSALVGAALLVLAPSALAETPATNAPAATAPSGTNVAPAAPTKPGDLPATPSPANPPAPGTTTPAAPGAPAPAPSPAPAAPPTLKWNDYINDLTLSLHLSDSDKAEIISLYMADGPQLKNILNNDALSSLQKADEVADLRGVRNAKIDDLLRDVSAQQTFHKVEAKYRVALTLLAADGGLVPPPPAPAAK